MICAGSIEKIASFEERTVEACSAFASSPCLRSVMSTIRPIERVARRPSGPSAKKVALSTGGGEIESQGATRPVPQ